ncbi:MAG: hypothetical protein WDN04_01200 [Rhodospirillales bacterium]
MASREQQRFELDAEASRLAAERIENAKQEQEAIASASILSARCSARPRPAAPRRWPC